MYSQLITHLHRTAFIIAVDCSTSMQEAIEFNKQRMRKADAVAIVCNYILDELLERATRHCEVRNYYDIAVVGYSNDDIIPIIPEYADTLISIDRLAEIAPKPERFVVEAREASTSTELILRKWIEPRAAGRTPMLAALTYIYTLLERWCSMPDNIDSFPPMVFNITDGEATDATANELVAMAQRICKTGTSDGETLLINVHLGASTDDERVIFPSEQSFDYKSEYQLTLYRMSSIMPKTMEPLIEELTTASGGAPYRGMALNVTPSELFTILNIGSESIYTA